MMYQRPIVFVRYPWSLREVVSWRIGAAKRHSSLRFPISTHPFKLNPPTMGGEEASAEGELVHLPLAAEFSDHHGSVTAITLDDAGQHLFSADNEVWLTSLQAAKSSWLLFLCFQAVLEWDIRGSHCAGAYSTVDISPQTLA